MDYKLNIRETGGDTIELAEAKVASGRQARRAMTAEHRPHLEHQAHLALQHAYVSDLTKQPLLAKRWEKVAIKIGLVLGYTRWAAAGIEQARQQA